MVTESQAPRRETVDRTPRSAPMDPHGLAIREGNGVREEVGFFGPGQQRMLGHLHVPTDGPLAGAVICSPIAAEFEKNYRRELLLAKALAARGIAAQRFHYRGAGHSDGATGEFTFETMRDDALAAAKQLKARTGVPRLAFVGTRWGGLVAASAAAQFDEAPVALWEPTLDGQAYLREIFRIRRMGQMRDGADPPTRSNARPVGAPEEGRTDLLGYALAARFIDTAGGRSLADELGSQPRSVLLVQFGRGGLPAAHGSLVDRWRTDGLEVEVRVVDDRESWWFGEHGRGGKSLAEETAGWLTERLVSGR